MRKPHYFDALGLVIPGLAKEILHFNEGACIKAGTKEFKPKETWKERKARLKAERKAKKGKR